MIAQATMNGVFGLFSMPDIFGFWRSFFVKRPVRPDMLIPVVHIEDHPHPDYWYGSVYPIKRGDDAERADDMRYAYVPFSDGKYKFEEATYFRAEGLAETRIEHEIPKMTSTNVRRFDTERPLEREDKTWLVETIERQRQKPKRKRELKL